jgi:DNA-binding MarR family transcriptional regulator
MKPHRVKNTPLTRQAEEITEMFPKLFLAITAVESRVKQTMHPHEKASSPLTHQQMHLLGTLELSGGRMRMHDLARMLCISRATLSVNVKRLIRSGYLAKNRDKQDERGVHVETAAKARRAFAAERRNRIAFFKAVFAALPENKRRRMIAAHRLIVETFQEVARQ